MQPRSLAMLTLFSALACSETQYYAYHPTEEVRAELSGYPASRYGVPPESPHGSVSVATFGVVDVEPQQGGDKVPMFCVRLVASNNGDSGPWRIDTRTEQVNVPHEGQSRAAFVNADTTGSPWIEVRPGDKHTIDFYYPLPASADPHGVPAFDFTWTIETPARAVSGRTPFEAVPYDVNAPHYEVVWGPYWWYDPFWPQATFAHPIFVRPGFRPYRVGGAGYRFRLAAPPAHAPAAPRRGR